MPLLIKKRVLISMKVVISKEVLISITERLVSRICFTFERIPKPTFRYLCDKQTTKMHSLALCNYFVISVTSLFFPCSFYLGKTAPHLKVDFSKNSCTGMSLTWLNIL